MNLNTKCLIELTINHSPKEVLVRNADTLLHTLRNQFGLIGAKPGCENGDCGSCTVIIDGQPQNACHTLAIETVGQSITTIEGLKDKTVQEAFVNNWAIQCGYCTPGFILNSYALLKNHPNADDDLIDDWLDSNICRCTGYKEIKQTVKELMEQAKADE